MVVMTTEVLRNMLLAGSDLLSGLHTVILDEVHFIQDPYRGGVWEEVLVLSPPEIRFVCLSATVNNASELGAWLRSVRGRPTSSSNGTGPSSCATTSPPTGARTTRPFCSRCWSTGIAQLKYGAGTPFNRLEQLESHLGIPLPAATQWEIVEEAAQVIKPARDELIRQAAQGTVIHNDDTGMRVLHAEARSVRRAQPGVFTSGIVSVEPRAGRNFSAFLHWSSRHAPHARGENIAVGVEKELPQRMPLCTGDAGPGVCPRCRSA